MRHAAAGRQRQDDFSLQRPFREQVEQRLQRAGKRGLINRGGDNQPISISKSAWQLPHTGITPKSLILTWGAGKTANDAVGDGRIRGDITGTINYAEGIIDLEHITLPALGQEYVAQYQYGEPVTERHVEPGRLSTPGQVGHLSITLDGAGGGATNLTPGSVHVKFNALYHKFDVDDQELVIETRDPIITLRDDGQGQLIDASGNVLGAIDYGAGTLHFMPDGSAPLPKPTYAWVTVGTRWEGNNQIAVQRWTMTGIQYHNTAYTFPDGEGGWVDVTYRNNNSAQAQNATLTAQALRIDVNHEYEVLYEFMEKLPYALAPGGRVAILTFHSGEDRIVKKAFKAFHQQGIYRDIAREVIRPSREECYENSRAHSTKLRWAIRAD